MEDFKRRCAYSMIHVSSVGGEHDMEVDHFNPTTTGAARHAYGNLYLACAHCNNKKRDTWPTAAERRKGVRLLDPCAEQDYGEHIFENPETHLLVGRTPAGRYHILVCDLNAPVFVNERRRRSEILRSIHSRGFKSKKYPWAEMLAEIAALKEIVEAFIPEIPPPP